MAEECVSLIPGVKELLADKGYDTNAIRTFLKERGVTAVIPSKSNRKKQIRHDKEAYKNRNVVDIDQSWRLSRLTGWRGRVKAWKQFAAKGQRRFSRELEAGDCGGVRRHQLGEGSLNLDRAAA